MIGALLYRKRTKVFVWQFGVEMTISKKLINSGIYEDTNFKEFLHTQRYYRERTEILFL